MCKISCDICSDLYPLVKDGIATEDSKKAVINHINNCEKCKSIYNSCETVSIDENKIERKIKKKMTFIAIILVAIGILFGLAISTDRFMFYNIIIMPILGGIGYIAFKNKSYVVLLAIFICVYIRFFFDSLPGAFNGDFINALIGPLWWAIIYVSLSSLGVVIAFLFEFGFRREKKNEKDS